jgi:hypothetical protein
MKLSNLIELNLSENMKITPLAIENLSNLTKLELQQKNGGQSKITNECVMKLFNLRSLNLAENPVISDECVKNLTNLDSLDIWQNSRITNKGIENLSRLTSLRYLSSANSDSNLNQALVKLTNLIELGLCDDNASNETIKKLVNLRRLTIYYQSRELNYQGYSNLSHLTSLTVYNHKLFDEELKCMTNLISFGFSGDNISHHSISNLKKLTSLILLNTKNVGDEGIKDLHNLRRLDIELTSNISDNGIKNLTNLASIINYRQSQITSDGLKRLNNLVAVQTNPRYPL